MSESERILDPEVVALVQEVVDLPGSSLFKVPLRATSQEAASGEARVSVGESFLSSAERHLLQAHRDALADALLEACRAKLTEPPPTQTFLFPVERQSVDDWRLRAERLSRREICEFAGDEAASTLSEALGPGHVPATQLARISLRLRPNDEARICLALGQGQEGQRDEGIETLGDLLVHHPTPVYSSHAHFNLGFLFFEKGELGDAQRHYRRATSIDPTCAKFHACVVTTSLLLGEREECLRSAEALDELSDGDAVDQFIGMLQASKEQGVTRPGEVAEQLWIQIQDQLPADARRIASVLW